MTARKSSTSLPNIDKTPPAPRAIRDKLLALLDPKDPDSIFKVIDAIQADPTLALSCHDIAHDLGHRTYELYGFSAAMTFDNPEHIHHALAPNICAGGYTHGILEEMSLHDGTFLEHPESVCGTFTGDERASCFHGMGHVYMLAHSRNAPASILGCRVIKLSTDMYRCFEGVRMEQFWGNTFATTSAELGWDIERPLDTCRGVRDDEKPTCFLYSTFGYLRIHPKDYSGAAHLCTQSNLAESDAEFCLKGLGMTMMSKFKGKNMEASAQYVMGLSTEQKTAYYQGVTNYARLSGVTVTDLTHSCELLQTDVEICLSVLQKY